MQMLYDYLTSNEFLMQVGAIVEGFSDLQDSYVREKRAMERVWKKREVQIKKVLLNVSRMYGELQGVMGNALPDIKTLSLPQGGKKKNN